MNFDVAKKEVESLKGEIEMILPLAEFGEIPNVADRLYQKMENLIDNIYAPNEGSAYKIYQLQQLKEKKYKR